MSGKFQYYIKSYKSKKEVQYIYKKFSMEKRDVRSRNLYSVSTESSEVTKISPETKHGVRMTIFDDILNT